MTASKPCCVQQLNGRLIFSASDINNFLACEHLGALEFEVFDLGRPKPDRTPEQVQILNRLGEAHERAHLDRLRASGATVLEIDRRDGIGPAASATAQAMRQGVPVIYQAAFKNGDWIGYADFLRRIERPSDLGSWQYEVLDTKLARQSEPYFLLQLCYYSEQVAFIQGCTPAHAYLILGDGHEYRFATSDFFGYYRHVKARFEAFIRAHRSGQHATYPVPNSHCSLCVWDPTCTSKRIADDHLSLVANMTRLQTSRLNAAGIQTLAALAQATLADRPRAIAATTFERIARQARLQFEQRRAVEAGQANPYKFELLEPAAPPAVRGFGLLPPPSRGDVFFDMEGDPYYDIGTGLEYLFGAYTADDDGFHAMWGCERSAGLRNDRLAEKRAFEACIDFLMKRLRNDPAMHIYHYASYEKTALQKLSLRHGTREEQVDEILRRELLVDLYTVVRQSIAVGQPGYSIKKLEAYYQARDVVAIKAGDESILQFERWLQSRMQGSPQDKILEDLRAYNEQDCRSTHALREWLLRLRTRAIDQFGIDIPYFTGRPVEAAAPRADAYTALKEQLQQAVPEGDEGSPLWLSLQMLEYHWREDKPVHWQFHDRCARYAEDPESLLEDSEAICDLQPFGNPSIDKQSLIYTLRFPAQQHKISEGTAYRLSDKTSAGTIVKIEEFDDFGVLHLRRAVKRRDEPLPRDITVRSVVSAGAVRDALARFAESLLDGSHALRYRAAYDILTQAPPRRKSGRTTMQPDTLSAQAITEVIKDAGHSYVFIQGPPGTGKTYSGARAIVALLEHGARVGVTANSHKAIHNMLHEVERVAAQRSVSFSGLKKISKESGDHAYHSEHGFIAETTTPFAPEDAQLFAGTPWAFGPAAMDGALDYLFIDEAGQVSLPNAIACATAAKNVVLLGDPLQLSQVSHTRHPGNVGASVLEHLLGSELAPVRPDRGIFLADTYRMHPAVCAFVSDMLYEGRLHAAAGRELQRIEGARLTGSGLRFVPVEHAGNQQSSPQEARVIAELAAELLEGRVTNIENRTRPLEQSDIIVVTPYNAQRRALRKELDARNLFDVKAGTVDLFQGQEAYVVFFSTAASSAEDAARGIDFIFDRNRLNVAVSRARALAVLVGSPQLFDGRATTIDQARTLSGALSFLQTAAHLNLHTNGAAESVQLSLL